MPDGMQQQPMHMNPQMQQPVPTQPQAQVRGGREVGGRLCQVSVTGLPSAGRLFLSFCLPACISLAQRSKPIPPKPATTVAGVVPGGLRLQTHVIPNGLAILQYSDRCYSCRQQG